LFSHKFEENKNSDFFLLLNENECHLATISNSNLETGHHHYKTITTTEKKTKEKKTISFETLLLPICITIVIEIGSGIKQIEFPVLNGQI
jgi:hypothetical protein